MNVETILNGKGRDVLTVAPNATILEASRVLRSKRIGALVVSSDGADVLGIISERDIVEAFAEHGAGLTDMQVEQLMTREVKTCVPTDTGRDLLETMTEGRFRHLPVLEDGVLSGIVSIGDAVKSRLDEITREAEAMRGYIAGT